MYAVPAMSMCAHFVSFTNSCKNTPAIEAPVPVEPAKVELIENPTQEQLNIFMRDKGEIEEVEKDDEETEYQNLHSYYDEDDVEMEEFQVEMPEREFDEDGGTEEGEAVEIEITSSLDTLTPLSVTVV